MRSKRERYRSFLDSGKGRRWLLALAIAGWLVHHHFVFLGFYNNDDISYARLAHQWLEGNLALFHPGNHLALRWTPVLVTAFFYQLFGINELTTSAYGFLTLAGTGCIIYGLLRKESLPVYFAALVLFFGNYSVIFYTHRLLPDSGICGLIFAAWYCYHRFRFGGVTGRWYWPVLFAVANALALATKETILMALPLYLVYVIGDLGKADRRRFWMIAIPVLATLLFVYLLIFRVYTGDWLYRYHLLQNGQYVNACRYDLLPVAETVKRVLYSLWYNFLLNGDMIYLATGFTAWLYRKKLQLSAAVTQLAAAYMILLLTADLMTISATHYVPLCEDPRHFLFLMPFAAVTASFLVRDYLVRPKNYPILPLVFALVTAILFGTGGGEIRYIYAMLTVLLVSWYFMAGPAMPAIVRPLVAAAFVATIAVVPLYDVYSNKQGFYYDHKKMIAAVFSQNISQGLVFTGDDLTAELSEYFLHFNTGEIRFQNLKRSDPAAGEEVYLLVNAATSSLLNEPFAKEAKMFEGGGLDVMYRQGTLILYRVKNKNSLAALKPFAVY